MFFGYVQHFVSFEGRIMRHPATVPQTCYVLDYIVFDIAATVGLGGHAGVWPLQPLARHTGNLRGGNLGMDEQ